MTNNARQAEKIFNEELKKNKEYEKRKDVSD